MPSTKRVVPVVVAATVAIGSTVYVLNTTGTCQVEDGAADAGPPGADGAPSPGADAGPPPAGTNSVKVTLHPLESGRRTISFGLPMPPGALDDADHLKVRVGDAELPARVRSLGTWPIVPPEKMRCSGPAPEHPGLRSVLIQFELDVEADRPVAIAVDVGPDVSRTQLAGEEVPARSTTRVLDDPGRLYDATDGLLEPAVLAAIDPAWLRCSLVAPLLGESLRTPGALETYDLAERNFFFTAIADYRSTWDAPRGSWPVDPVNDPPLDAADDGVWLYQRAQTFFGLYARTGMLDALRSFYAAADHYRTLLYDADDCEGVNQAWCLGFFSLKNPDRAAPYKDPKYSYAEDLATYYWLTGDELVLPYIGWVRSAEVTGVPHVGWTERFQAYLLASHVVEYEVTGSAGALLAAQTVVDGLLARQARPTSDGCIVGNTEWSADDGFSPWMGAILAQQLVRYFMITGDARIPDALVKQARCTVDHGMAIATQGSLAGKLIPFYGARSSTTVDADGDNPWAGWEHCANVAQGIALGYLFSDDQELRRVALELMVSAESNFANWTRETAGRPKFRLAPWRKYNWWFRQSGQLQWALGKPEML